MEGNLASVKQRYYIDCSNLRNYQKQCFELYEDKKIDELTFENLNDVAEKIKDEVVEEPVVNYYTSFFFFYVKRKKV